MAIAAAPAANPLVPATVPKRLRLGAESAQVDGGGRVEWLLKRNCSIAPRQLLGVYLSLCAVSLAIAIGFSWAGAPPVLVFAGVELLLVGAALLVWARHATDHERITLSDGALSVEHHHGALVERRDFRAARVRVESLSCDGSLIEVAADGRSVRIGRYTRPELRSSLARELRAALGGHRVPSGL